GRPRFARNVDAKQSQGTHRLCRVIDRGDQGSDQVRAVETNSGSELHDGDVGEALVDISAHQIEYRPALLLTRRPVGIRSNRIESVSQIMLVQSEYLT